MMMMNNERLLRELEDQTETSRQIALLRIHYVHHNGQGLASAVVPLVTQAMDAFWTRIHNDHNDNNNNNNSTRNSSELLHHNKQLSADPATVFLRRVLRLYSRLSRLDPTLHQEMGGFPRPLIRLVQCCDMDELFDDDDDAQDTIMELQDLACEIAAIGGTLSPKSQRLDYSLETLCQRLPLDFVFSSSTASTESKNEKSSSESLERILIHQVTARQSAQADVGFGRFLVLG